MPVSLLPERVFMTPRDVRVPLPPPPALCSGADRTLVFVETKRNADYLASLLSQEEFPTTSIHG